MAYLGLDLGGTGAKAGVFDRAGRQLGFGRAAFTPSSPAAGFAEIPMPEIHAAARKAVRMALQGLKCTVRAMAISSQGQTFVTLDENDRPLHPAIMWYDSRGAAQAERLEKLFAGIHAGISSVTAIASVTKIQWLKEKIPDRMRHARRYLLLPDYFAYHLIGRAVMDDNTAGSTGLYLPDKGDFCATALAACGIDREQLSEVALPGSLIGTVLPKRAEEWGLTPQTRLVVGTNDQYAGALGAGNCRPCIATVTFGTCMALITLADSLKTPLPPGIYSGPYPIPGLRFLLAFAKTSGVLLDWFRREFDGGMTFDELNLAAVKIPPGSRGLIVVPHFDGQVSPKPDNAARGRILNLTLQHTRADIYRAILEGLSFCLHENLDCLRQHGYPVDVVRAIGGGARNEFWLQMQADITGMPVEQPAVLEAAMLGAAMLAMSGLDGEMSIAKLSSELYRSNRVFQPNREVLPAYQATYARYRQA